MTQMTVKYGAIALLGILVSFLLFFRINHDQIKKRELEVRNAIATATLKIEDEIQKIELVLESMAFYFEKTPSVSQETFQNFTNPLRNGLNGNTLFAWAPSILESEKKEYEKKASKALSKIIKGTDSSNNFVPSLDQKLYYPVSLVNPMEQMEGSLGYDLNSDTTRKLAIAQSSSSKKMAISGPIDLVHDQEGVLGFLAVKTVFEPDGIATRGVVAAASRMDDFLKHTLSDELKLVDVSVQDQFAEGSLLYSSLAERDRPINEASCKTTDLAAAGRIWSLGFYPIKDPARFPHTLESYIVLLFGLVITWLIVVNTKSRDDRNILLEKRVKQRTVDLELTNEQLAVSNKQKENLLREIHHRVMNNLQIASSLMNLQKRKLRDEGAIYALTSSQDRINAIALIHQKIYQHDGVDAVDFKGYLENLINTHKRISPDTHYVIQCPEIFIDLDSAVPLAIITFEIVTNALKHAFSENLKSKRLEIIVKKKEGDVIDITISDNGSGLPKNESSKKSGLGQEIIKKLCRQLAAEYQYSSSESGTTFGLSFKQRKLQIPVFD